MIEGSSQRAPFWNSLAAKQVNKSGQPSTNKNIKKEKFL
jgi:hypothetical protein